MAMVTHCLSGPDSCTLPDDTNCDPHRQMMCPVADAVAVTQARHDETALAQGTSTDAAKVLGQSTTLAIQATEGSGGLPEQKTGDKG